jgi:hypothetical protein
MAGLTPAFEYFAQVSQEAITIKPPHRGVVSMLHYGDYVLITSEIKSEIQRRWFHQENPIYYYHLPKQIRLHIVNEMWTSGCNASEIADLIGVSHTTITNDLKEIKKVRVITVLPQYKPEDRTPEDLVLKSSVAQKQQDVVVTPSRWNN